MRRLSLAVVSLFLAAGCGYEDTYTGAGGGTAAAGGGTGADFDAGACTDTWASFGATFFTDDCAGCHGAYSSHSAVQAGSRTLASAVSSGAMPQGGGLASTDRARAVLYLRCGAP